MFLKDHGKTALIYQDVHISYKELIERCDRYASLYRLKKGDRVGLFSENRPEWIYAFFSAWHHGGVVVPMDFTAPVPDLAYILADSAPSAVFCSAEGEKTLRGALRKAGIRPKLLVFETAGRGKATGRELRVENVHDTAVIMYTSGTTGKAKGVMISYDNLLASIEGIDALGMLTRDDTIIGLLPFHHIFPFQGTVLAPLYLGSTVAMVKTLVSDEILRTLREHGVTMFLGVPKLYELFHNGIMGKVNANPVARAMLAAARGIGNVTLSRALFGKVHAAFGGRVHSYLTGGAPMDEAVRRNLWGLGFRLVEGYGLTETAPLVAFNPFSKIKPGSVGRPMAGTEVKIEDGEILVRGRNVMKGYYKKPRETARALRGGWFHTGDTGRFDKDGYLYLTGRKDEMIVLPNGKNINPEEIERRILAASPLIKDIGVIYRDGRLSALVVPDMAALQKSGVVNILETIKWKVLDRYNAEVPPYRRITHFSISRGELPRTRLGKLKRYLLQGRAEAAREERRKEPEPGYREYAVIRDYLRKLLSAEVRPSDHLELDLGLDSLSMVELQVFLESAFGIEFGEEAFASLPTVESLAAYIRDHRTTLEGGEVNWNRILSEAGAYTIKEQGLLFRIFKKLTRPFLMWYFRLRHRGLEHLPESPYIIAPNHQSFLDVFLLAVTLPDHVLRKTFFIARESLAKSRIIRLLSRKANVIFINIEKDLKGALQKSAAVLRHGQNLVIFPEGHRSRDGRLGTFKKSFAILSKELDIPVIPLAIKGAFEAWAGLRLFPRPHRVELTFCKPVYPGEFDYDRVAARVQSEISRIVES